MKCMADREVGGHVTRTSNLVIVLQNQRIEQLVVAVLTVLVFAMSVCRSADGAVCENEALRSSLGSSLLPDCRAYEMVTPPYKDGYPMFVESFAANGEKVILDSVGGLADTPGTGEGGLKPNLYIDERTAGGWRLSAMNAPLSQFVGELGYAFEAEEGLSLWVQHTPHQSAKTDELYIRSADGTYERVGPVRPDALSSEAGEDVIEAATVPFDEPVGATSDYRHVVLAAEKPQAIWPFDKTGVDESLYEYSGVNNEAPVLVGEKGAKGTHELVADCGVHFGGEGLTYNAISREGESIFFTVNPCGPAPSTTEVFARLHGAMITPAPAETIDISERECSGAECEVESGKNFEGASESGEKVFFTSTQKLTEGAADLTDGGSAAEGSGCASSGEGCNLYEYNFALPAHNQLALVAGGTSDVRGVAGIAEDGSHVYFVAEGGVSGASENEFHHKPVLHEPDLYVYDSESKTVAFIATLSSADEKDWERQSLRPVQVAGENGQFLLFVSSAAGVTPDETSGGLTQLFEYDAETRELVRVTQGEEGFNDNGNSATEGIPRGSLISGLGYSFDFRASENRLDVSSDGRTVVFQTAGELSPRARSASSLGCKSVYEFRSEGPISAGKVYLLSDGRDVQLNKGSTCGAFVYGMDEDGSNVLVSTADPLLTSDVDGFQRDIYDARVGGGFPPGPVQGESAVCVPSTCEGAVPVGGGTGVAASAAEGDFPSATGSGTRPASVTKKPGKPSKSKKTRKKSSKVHRKRRGRALRVQGKRLGRRGV